MRTAQDEIIGFAGLGLTGFPMADRIARAGQPMAVSLPPGCWTCTVSA